MHRFDLLTRRNLARRFGVTPQTIHVWERDKGLPVIVFAGRLTLYDIDAVEKWLAAQQRH